VICRFYWESRGLVSPGFSGSCSPWLVGVTASLCPTSKSGASIFQHSHSTCGAWVFLFRMVSCLSTVLSRKHAVPTVGFPCVCAALHHVSENICDLLSLFLFSYSLERRRRMCFCQYERLPSVSRERPEARLLIPSRCFSQRSVRCEHSALCFFYYRSDSPAMTDCYCVPQASWEGPGTCVFLSSTSNFLWVLFFLAWAGDSENSDGADDAAANTAVLVLEGGVCMPSCSAHVSSSFHMDSSTRHLSGGAFYVCPFLNMCACSTAPYDLPLPRPINRTGSCGLPWLRQCPSGDRSGRHDWLYRVQRKPCRENGMQLCAPKKSIPSSIVRSVI
jgi:hypothetical protein